MCGCFVVRGKPSLHCFLSRITAWFYFCPENFFVMFIAKCSPRSWTLLTKKCQSHDFFGGGRWEYPLISASAEITRPQAMASWQGPCLMINYWRFKTCDKRWSFTLIIAKQHAGKRVRDALDHFMNHVSKQRNAIKLLTLFLIWQSCKE